MAMCTPPLVHTPAVPTHMQEHPCVEQHDSQMQEDEQHHEALPCMPGVGVVRDMGVVP